MFLPSRSIAVKAFTPSALPDFFAIPAFIPSQLPSFWLPLKVAFPYSARFPSRTKSFSGLPGCFYISVLLDAVCDPGVESGSRLYRACLCCLSSLATALATQLVFRGSLPDSASYASPLNLSSTPWFSVRFRCRVSVLTLSTMSRVPNYSLARITHFDENTGWLTTPFPRGFSPP